MAGTAPCPYQPGSESSDGLCCRWAKCSWFSTPPSDVGLQPSGTTGSSYNVSDNAGGKRVTASGAAAVGGAAAQNRFAGRTAAPVGTTAPLDGSPVPAVSESLNPLEPNAGAPCSRDGRRESAGMVAYGGAIAHSRFNDRKRPAASTCGRTCDEALLFQGQDTSSGKQGAGALQWQFNWEVMQWEQRSAAEPNAKHVLAARRCGLPC